jgi:hypothetical protein
VLVGAVASLAAVSLGVRLLWSQSHPRIGFALDRNLVLISSPLFLLDLYGVESGLHVDSLDDRPVDSLDDLRSRIDSRCLRLGVGANAPNTTTREVIWAEPRSFDRIEVVADGRLIGLPACTVLSEHEEVVAINGETVGSPGALADALPGAVRARTRLSLRMRGAGADRVLLMRAVDWPAAWAMFGSGVLFAGLGIATVALKPRARSAHGFLAFCLAVAAFSWLRSIPHHYRSPLEQQSYYLVQAAIPLATAVFIATFTAWRRVFRSLRWVALVFGGITVVALGLNLGLWPEDATRGVLAPRLLVAWAASLLVLLVLGSSADVALRRLGLEVGPEDRGHGRALRLALVLGLFPLTIYTALQGWAGWGDWRALFELSTVLFPLVIAYAVVRLNLLGLNALVSEGLRRGPPMAILAVGAALVIGLAAPLSERLLPDAPWWVGTTLVAAVVLMTAAGYTTLKRRLERGRLRRDATPEEMLEALEVTRGRNLGLVERCQLLVDQAATLAGASNVGLLLRRPGTTQWCLAAARDLDRGPRREACDELLSVMDRDRRPLFRKELVEDGAVVARGLVASMDELSAAVTLPLIAGDRLIGVLSLGSTGERDLSAGELRRLRDLASFGAVDLGGSIQQLLDDRGRRIAALYPELPPSIAGWSIERALGRGGMACVYLGSRGGVRAAIKVPTVDVQDDSALRQRFSRECGVMKRIDHPHVVRVLEVGQVGEEPFAAMEYCAGGTLRERLDRAARLSEEEVWAALRQIASGLEAAHRAGVLHRDVKPANILFDEHEMVKVGDFGLARLLEESTITSTGAFLGTPTYVAPEIIRGRQASPQSDQYSLGICGIEMLIGRRPVGAAGGAEALVQHLAGDLPRVREHRPEVSMRMEGLITRLTAMQPEQRFASWGDVLGAMGTT